MPKTPCLCSNCGKEFMAWPYTLHEGRPRFCSRFCHYSSIKGRWVGENNPNWINRPKIAECPQCNSVFEPARDDQVYCSKECGNKSRQRREVHVCEQCGKSFEREMALVKSHGGNARFCGLTCMGKWNSIHLRGENSPHWLGGKDRPSAQPEYLSEQYHIRRAREANAPINDFTNEQWEELLSYFDHRCGYCNRKMDRLDREHMIPISRGGNHSLENIIPACRRCNVRKNDRTLLEFVAFAGLQNA